MPVSRLKAAANAIDFVHLDVLSLVLGISRS